jgi:hypothetical protein
MKTSISKGSKWTIVKDLKGLPTHEQGGVDLIIDKGKVHFSNGKSTMYAKYGMRIPKKQEDLNKSEKKSIFTKGLEWYQIQMPCGGYAENGAVIPRKQKEVEPLYSAGWRTVDSKDDFKKYAKCGCQIRNNSGTQSINQPVTRTKYGRK